MRKIKLLLAVIVSFIFVSCSCESSNDGGNLYTNQNVESSSNTIRAGIIAEDFVKEKVLSPKDLEFDLVGVDEESTDEYHVVANIKTLNGMGMMVARKVSVRLRYEGGEWEDKNSWSVISIKALNPANGKSEDW